MNGGGREIRIPRLCRLVSTSRAPTSKKKVGLLSRAGSATACTSAKTLAASGNVLMLDEPTNDLDVETLGQPWNPALEDFPGCAVVISHDRFFLDQPGHPHPGLPRATVQVDWFEGNFEAYEEGQRSAAWAPTALIPPPDQSSRSLPGRAAVTAATVTAGA